jgi:hypothetical protein
MTRRAIIRRRVYYVGSSKAETHDRSVAVAPDAPHLRFREPPLLQEELDPTASRWWRATRMGRRPNPFAKN